MSKNPITVYWSPFYTTLEPYNKLSYMHQLPKPLFSELMQVRVLSDDAKTNPNFLTCPAISSKFKNTFVFKTTVDSSYSYDVTSTPPKFDILDKQSLLCDQGRMNHIQDGPILMFDFSNIFFADEPLNAYFTPPIFHKPKYTNYGTIIPGEFDIGQWFRPYHFEMQTWSNKGEVHIKNQEPIFYVEFKTDRPIIFKRFVLTQKLIDYAEASVGLNGILGLGQTLADRYKRFKDVGMKEKILKEIKDNLLD